MRGVDKAVEDGISDCGIEDHLVPMIVTGDLNPRIDGAACAGEDKGAVKAPGLFNGMAIQSDGLSVASSVR